MSMTGPILTGLRGTKILLAIPFSPAEVPLAAPLESLCTLAIEGGHHGRWNLATCDHHRDRRFGKRERGRGGARHIGESEGPVNILFLEYFVLIG
jgi:hypothetical protein